MSSDHPKDIERRVQEFPPGASETNKIPSTYLAMRPSSPLD